MQRLKYISIILTVFIGCTNHSDKKVPIDLDSINQTDTVVDSQIKPNVDTFSIPTKTFIKIVAFLDSSNFVPDTARIKDVGYYWQRIKTNPVFKINSIPFFIMDTTSNPIFHYLNSHAKDTREYPVKTTNYFEQSISRQIIKDRTFHKVKNITGFFFRDKTPPSDKENELWADGFIEEWEFKNSEDAKKAEVTLKNRNLYMLIYFNSIAFVNRKDNYLYTYYSRSCWADRRLNKVFKEIIERQNNE